MVFGPADGVKARWRKIYEYVIGLKNGTCVSYEELGELLGITDRHAIQAAAARAARELRKGGRTLTADYGKGYWVTYHHADAFVNTADRSTKERVRARENRTYAKGENLILRVPVNEFLAYSDILRRCSGELLRLWNYGCVLSENNRDWDETQRVAALYRSTARTALKEIDDIFFSASVAGRAWLLSKSLQPTMRFLADSSVAVIPTE